MAFLNFGTSKLFWATGQGEETGHSLYALWVVAMARNFNADPAGRNSCAAHNLKTELV